MPVTAPRRRAHGNEHRVGSGHRRLEIAREAQPSGCHVAGNEMVEPGLVDRHLAARQALDLRGILIDAGDLDAELREARPGNQPDIPGPDHRYAHERGLPIPNAWVPNAWVPNAWVLNAFAAIALILTGQAPNNL